MSDTELLNLFEKHMGLAREARARGAESVAAKHEFAAELLFARRKGEDHDHVKEAA